jgi:murein endopeptidase
MQINSIAFFDQLQSVFNVKLGDVSNMNGGWFFSHTGHQTGRELDLWFDGYNDRDAVVAQKLISIINYFSGPASPGRITKIYVAYPENDSANSFTKALADAPDLAGGGRPSAIIRPESTHTTHFHVYLAPLARYPR